MFALCSALGIALVVVGIRYSFEVSEPIEIRGSNGVGVEKSVNWPKSNEALSISASVKPSKGIPSEDIDESNEFSSSFISADSWSPAPLTVNIKRILCFHKPPIY